MKKVAAIIIVILMFAPAAWACNYTFDVSLLSRTVDANRSAADTFGFDDWYVWKYKVEVITGDVGKPLCNWVLELPDCYVTSPGLFKEIEASASKSWNGDCKLRVYDPDAVNPDPSSGLSGLRWTFLFWDRLDSPGEFDYFWFSVPTNLDIETDWAVKARNWCGGSEIVRGTVEGPRCPPNEVIPEPMSIILLGTGIVGLVIRNGKRGAV